MSFTLRGAGWGHGVGLCQIGAAVMGAKGYPYTDILSHYFPGADLTTLYDVGMEKAMPARAKAMIHCIDTVHQRLVRIMSTKGLQNGLITLY